MLVSKVTCPECGTVLRPAKPLPVGKKVKCPKCSTLFTAEAEAAEPVAANPAEGAKQKAAPLQAAPEKPADKKKYEDDDDGGGGTYGVLQEEPEKKKAKVKAKPKNDDDEDDEDEDEEEEDDGKPKISYAPDTSIKDLRGPAQAAVMRPSNALLFTGITGFIGWLIFLVMLLIGRYLPVQPDVRENQTGDPHRPIVMIGPGLSGVASSGSSGPGGMPGMPNTPDMPGLPGMAGKITAPPKPAPKSIKEPPGFFELFGVELVPMADEGAYFFTFAVIILIGMAYSCTLTYGGVQLQSLESRGWGIVASVLAMVPLFNSGGLIMVVLMIFQILLILFMEEFWWIAFTLLMMMVVQCLASAAAGLWALLTCIDEDVIAGFEYEGE